MPFWRRDRLSDWILPFESGMEPERFDRSLLIDFMLGKMPHFIWNTMAVFEDSTATLQNTLDVLSTGELLGLGKNSENIPFEIQILNFRNALKFLCDCLTNGTFELSFEMAAKINSLAGAEIEHYRPGESGKLRIRKVHVGTEYIPPDPGELKSLVKPVFRDLNHIRNPFDRAVMTFGALSKLQFFLNGNKRTSLLMMNGVLVSEGVHPVFFPRKWKRIFDEYLFRCYNNGDISGLSVIITSI